MIDSFHLKKKKQEGEPASARLRRFPRSTRAPADALAVRTFRRRARNLECSGERLEIEGVIPVDRPQVRQEH